MKFTVENLVRAIDRLPKNVHYDYPSPESGMKVIVESISLPSGPIVIKRYDTKKGQSHLNARLGRISQNMLIRFASAVEPGTPLNVDRLFGGSYNTRSSLECLVAHTPDFYVAMLDRIEERPSGSVVKPGHKHLIYSPNDPHTNGLLGIKPDVKMQISERSFGVVYKDIEVIPQPIHEGIPIDQLRRHAQIQVALVQIGNQLGFRTWVASNDKGIVHDGKRLDEHECVVDNLSHERVLSAYPDAVNAAKLIDVVWFKNGRLMPAVLEIEHSTGVTSGLTRMKGFMDQAPALEDIRWTIVGPDEDREKVHKEANREQFRQLKTRFFPYRALEELYYLCKKRGIEGVTNEFLDCFMERCVH